MKYIPKELAREIRQRYDSLSGQTSPSLALKTKKAERKVLLQRAQVHSFRIEHPELRVPYNVPRGKGRRMIKQGVECLENAFQWGAKNFNPNEFCEPFVQEIAGRVLCGNHAMPYRRGGVTISGASVTPPDPHKVQFFEMPAFYYNVNELLHGENILNKIGAAIFAHLHLARIHPFDDGNGRTARITQDVMLDHYRIPPPVIEVGERMTYYSILDRAVYDWKHKKHSGEIKNGATEGESVFYTFIAGKINASLDRLVCNSNNPH